MVRTIHLLREALLNLRRNALVVMGAVLAVFVSLTLAFGALVVNELVRVNTVQWQQGEHMIVWLKDSRDGITDAAQANLYQEILSWEEVETARFVSKAEAYEEAKVIFADQPSILEELDPALLPASIRIGLNDIVTYQDLEYRLSGLAPVRKVVSLGERIDQLATLTRVLNTLGIGLALVLGLSAVILIANTIRMAIYARRDEVGIMKLVGASNWFIRVPFLLEGVIEGLAGAALAVVAVWLGTSNLRGAGEAIEVVTFSVPNDFFLRWGPAFLLFGVAAGFLGSLLGLRRFLKV